MTGPDRAGRLFLVRGRVQGVGFRHFVLTRARRLGLAGWVRNLPDGRVEVAASADSVALDELARALAEGPPASRVEGVEVETLTPVPEGDRFEVRFS